jgi:hypothetical protein
MRFISPMLIGVLLLAASVLGLVLLVSEGRCLVPGSAAPDAEQRAWARQWIKAHDPRRRPDGTRVTLAISEQEASLLANYLVSRLGPGQAEVRIASGRAEVLASIGLPWNPSGAWLNLRLGLVAAHGMPQVETARIGGLPFPAGLAKALAERAMAGFSRARVLESLELTPGRAVLAYTWRRGVLDVVGTNLLAPEDQGRLLLYQADAMAMAPGRPILESVPLAELLTRLLAKASERSAGGDPVAENRAALAAAAAYANRRLIRDIDAGDTNARRPPMHPVVLRGRRDLAQHFTISAAVAAQGSSLFSDAAGLVKELTDADGGSGFSFADLAADRAGVRFAELATGDRAGAERVQQAAVAGLAEGAFMIDINGLPEAISKVRLERVYGGTQGEGYRALAERIEGRIARLPLYHRAPRRVAGEG